MEDHDRNPREEGDQRWEQRIERLRRQVDGTRNYGIYVSPSYINDNEVGGGGLCSDQLIQGIWRQVGWVRARFWE